jgi:glycosyltransferase involved in cell wall biosynthesis
LAALIGCALKTPSITCIQGFDLHRANALQRCTELRTALRCSRSVLAVTDELKAGAAAISGRRDIAVIPHGLEPAGDIDAEVDRLKKEAAAALRGRILLYVGQLHERKGLTELLDAMQRVHSAAPDVALVLVGRGPLEERLRQQARRARLEGVVRFMGPRPHGAVMAFMRLADVFVLPSREEPFGIVLIEAMSQGLPIVATDVQHIPHLVRPGVNGFLSAPGDTDGLAGNILRLFADPDEAAAIGRRNREEASRYDWKRLAARYERIYAESRRQTHAEAA